MSGDNQTDRSEETSQGPKDNGGRRSGKDRRQFQYTFYIPERRIGPDRRGTPDRRKKPRTRAASQ
jgi:hypothetical protein